MMILLIVLILSKIVLNASSITVSGQLPNLYPSLENSPIITNPWTVSIFIRLRISLWSPLFEEITDQKFFKEILILCINRGITPPQPPIFIRILEYEHLTGLTGVLFEFPRNGQTEVISRENILQFLIQCREDKLGGEVHIASNILLRNSPAVQIASSLQEFKLKKIEEDYSMATTFTITFLMVATTLSVISAYVIYYSVAKNKK